MLSSELAGKRPSLRYFNGTAAMAMVDAVARAVPILATRKLVADPEPLFEAPEVPLP